VAPSDKEKTPGRERDLALGEEKHFGDGMREGEIMVRQHPATFSDEISSE